MSSTRFSRTWRSSIVPSHSSCSSSLKDGNQLAGTSFSSVFLLGWHYLIFLVMLGIWSGMHSDKWTPRYLVLMYFVSSVFALEASRIARALHSPAQPEQQVTGQSLMIRIMNRIMMNLSTTHGFHAFNALGENSDTSLPLFLSLIPFFVACISGRELRLVTAVLWYSSTLLICVQIPLKYPTRTLVVYSFAFAGVYFAALSFMTYSLYSASTCYQDAQESGATTGFYAKILCAGVPVSGPPADSSLESLWIVDLLCLGILIITLVGGVLSLTRFVYLQAVDLVARGRNLSSLNQENVVLKRGLRVYQRALIDKVDAPLTQVQRILQAAGKTSFLDQQTQDVLVQVMKDLGQEDLFAPKLESTAKDKEVFGFLSSLIQKGGGSIQENAKTTRRPTIRKEVVLNEPLEVIKDEIEIIPPTIDLVSIETKKEIQKLLTTVETPEFDAITLGEITGGHPLYYIGMWLFDRHGFISSNLVDLKTLQNFLLRVESGYYDTNPYHNAMHAADVVSSINYFLTRPKLFPHLSQVDILAAIIAAMVHDLQHPGFNNAFLINTNDKLAMLYNDSSVLENYHVSTCFEIMSDPSHNILSLLSPEDYKSARELIVGLVLATDISGHFEFVTKFKAKANPASFDINFEKRADRKLTLSIAMKCADVNNPTKPLDLCKKWTALVMEEFFRQGDEERKRGLDISALMDRNTTDIPKCQVGFISFIVAPLFESWSLLLCDDIKQMIDNMNSNKEYWKGRAENPEPNQSLGRRTSQFAKNVLKNLSKASGSLHSVEEI